MFVRAAFVAATLVLLVHADEDQAGTQVTQEIAEAGRQMRRFGGMLIPLLIGIAGRLAAIIPLAFLGTIGVLIFVALSTKAFVVSILSFMMHNKKQHMGMKVMHVHHYPHESHHDSHFHGSPSSFSLGSSPSGHLPPDYANYNPDAPPPFYYYDNGANYSGKKRKKWPKLDDDWNYMDGLHRGHIYQPPTTMRSSFKPRLTTLDSYLPDVNSNTYPVPQYSSQARLDSDVPPFLYSPQGVFYPRFLWANATERPLQPNATIGLTPLLDQVTEKIVQDQDPR